jgi:hypothetical protein
MPKSTMLASLQWTRTAPSSQLFLYGCPDVTIPSMISPREHSKLSPVIAPPCAVPREGEEMLCCGGTGSRGVLPAAEGGKSVLRRSR